MTTFPILPFHVADFVADTTHLSTAAAGAYMRLLFAAWQAKDCALPDDDEELARIVGLNEWNWGRMRNKVMAFWQRGPDNRWRQKRLLQTYKTVRAQRARRAAAGRLRHQKNCAPGNDLFFRNCHPGNNQLPQPVDNPVGKKIGGSPLPGPLEKNKNANEINGAISAMLPENPAMLHLAKSSIYPYGTTNPARAGPIKKIVSNSHRFLQDHRAGLAATSPDPPGRRRRREARQAWEAQLARDLGPVAFAQAVDVLAEQPRIAERATNAELRRVGDGVATALLALRQVLDRRAP